MGRARARVKAGHRTWAARNAPVPGGHGGDIMSPETRSRVMACIKGKNTKPERIIFSALDECGVAFVRHATNLPGRPDIMFPDARLVVFIDGDFWHGWRFPLWKHKLSDGWQKKIAETRKRDQRNFRKLRRSGWSVIRIWEHQIEKDIAACVSRVLSAYDDALHHATQDD